MRIEGPIFSIHRAVCSVGAGEQEQVRLS